MKFYKTVDGVMNYIRRNKQSGKEQSINEVLMCGMGVYAYSDVVTYSGVKNLTKSSDTFYHFTDESELKRFIEYLQKSDGYLYVA